MIRLGEKDMYTVKQLAQACGVSEQAIRAWCLKNGVEKGARGRFIIDDTAHSSILKHYAVELSQLAQDSECKGKLSQDVESHNNYQNKQIEELIKTLQGELEQRNKQLEEKDKQIERLQTALDQQQKLTAMQEQRINAIEMAPDTDETIQDKRHWWEFWKKQEAVI